MRKEVLESLLICPQTGAPLQWVEEEGVTPRLVVEGTNIAYPVVEGIVCFLPTWEKGLDPIKTAVQSFYDETGWRSTSVGEYRDARDSEDRREVSREYIDQCHARVGRHLPRTGQYLLDAASGPIQYPAYVPYSEGFQYRICADLSLTALKEAKAKLGDKGIYLLCDITQLPIRSNAIDAVVSLHTLYHVPAEQQQKGFAELHRVVVPGGRLVIVYSWGARSWLMNVTMFPFKIANRIYRWLFSKQSALYFHTHSYRWFCDNIRAMYATEILVWRSVTVPFMKVFIHHYWGGRYLLKMIAYIEERFPHIMGRIGAYPLLVSTKR